MKIETEYNIGDTVFFVLDGEIQKGVVNEIFINAKPIVTEIYEVKFVNRDYEEVTQDIGADSLFATPQALVEGLMLNFSNKEDNE